MKNIINLIILSIVYLFSSGCGEGHIDITDVPYNPKIVIDAYVYGGEKVKDIKITRNFPLNRNIDISQLFIPNATVLLTDISNNKTYPLSYNALSFSYEYPGNDLVIAYGKSYKLEVSANIDGKQLSASSVTSVPEKGLKANIHNLGEMQYRELDEQGEVRKITIGFTPSEKSTGTILSITALDASLNTYIYDNAYRVQKDTNKIKEKLDQLRQSFTWQQGIAPGTLNFSMNIEWFAINFYGRYRVIVYAADRNFHNYLLTAKNVMEQDGNFHEPKMYIEGDGIGVFGSAVKDTVYFSIK